MTNAKSISREHLIAAGYKEYELDEFQKRFCDSFGVKYFINATHDAFNSRELRSWWTFKLQFETPKGCVQIETVQWFNEDGELSGNKVEDVESYFERMWLFNGCPYYEQWEKPVQDAVLMYRKAFDFAFEKHRGQMDKTGKEPYIHHCVRVSMAKDLTDLERVEAMLHDTREDTNTSFEEIRDCFGEEVAVVVEALTHRPNEPREEYLARVKQHPSAIKVKRADIVDNMGRSKEGLDEFTIKRLAEKYKSYLKILDKE